MRFLARGGAADGLRALSRAPKARRARREPPSGLTVRMPTAASPARVAARVVLPLALGATPPPPIESVRLATQEWSLTGGEPWRGRFTDPEDALAAHRFGWIPQLLVTQGAGCARSLFDLTARWLDAHAGAPEGDGWDSYSVAERIAHWAYLISARPHDTAAPRVLAAIAEHAAFLRDHLELRGPATNNHLINDARALYLAGQLLDSENLRAQSRELVEFGAGRMLIDGFLREGSTHYQLLLTRTFLELAIASRACGDLPFAEQLAGWSRAMTDACRFIADGARNAVPLIGDLSPDFPPDFLIDLATAGMSDSQRAGLVAPGWAALFGSDSVPSTREPAEARARSEAGYFRAGFADWRVQAWVNPHGHVPSWSHAHADLGSFVSYWHGRPMLVDAGRATYADTPLGTYGRSVRSHNAISVDGHEPCVVHGLNGMPELMSDAYLQADARGEVACDDRHAALRISHAGFGRLGDGLEVARTITMSRDRLLIVDKVTGSGRHRVETYFQCAPEVNVIRVTPTTWRLAAGDCPPLIMDGPGVARHARGEDGESPAGWCSPEYGRAVPASTLTFSYDGPLPLVQRYEVRQV